MSDLVQEGFVFDIEKFVSPGEKYYKPWINDIERNMIIDQEETRKFIEILSSAKDEEKKILIFGKGRSGIVGDLGVSELVERGWLSYRFDAVPATLSGRPKEKNYVFFGASGSGTTESVVRAANIAKEDGVPVLSITSNPDSPLGRLSTAKIVTKSRTKENIENERETALGLIEPVGYLGSESEFKTHIALRNVIKCASNSGTFDEKRIRESSSQFRKIVDDVVKDLTIQKEDVRRFTSYFLPNKELGEKPENIEIHMLGRNKAKSAGKYTGVRFVNAGFKVYDVSDELTPPIDRKGEGVKRYILYALAGDQEIGEEFNLDFVQAVILPITSSHNCSLIRIAKQKGYPSIVLESRTDDLMESYSKLLLTPELVVNLIYKVTGKTEADARKGHKLKEL